MLISTKNLLNTHIAKSFHSNLRHFSKNFANFNSTRSYEGEGRTIVKILNRESDLGLMIDGFSQVGFRLNNGITVLGPVLVFPKCILSWCVKTVDDITKDSLSLFGVLEPKLDLIVIGTGDRINSGELYKKIWPFCKEHKLSLEILPTEQACTTFNFLNSEARYVAAALIPPVTIKNSNDDLMKTKMRYHNLYEI